MKKEKSMPNSCGDQWVALMGDASFMKWTAADVIGIFKYHPVPCVLAASLLFFMGVEYMLRMIPPSAPPFDIGFVATVRLCQGFLGSGADFPVGNVSFFLFYSGHVAASIIASLDMKRMRRWELARTFDVLNMLQVVRLLSTRFGGGCWCGDSV